jgi:hypothetical protein
MSFFNVLTLIFIVLKLLEVINWGWFYVLLPTLLQIILWVILIFFSAIMQVISEKS